VPAELTSGPLVVGAVFELYQGDLDVGRVALERLAHVDLGEVVALEDLSYGAVAVAQRLQELAPRALVLIGAERRHGRAPGTIERRELETSTLSPEDVQRAVRDAVTGYVGIELVIAVAHGLGALPKRVVAVEIEPAQVEPGAQLSPEALAGLERALELVRAAVRDLR